MHGQGGSSHSAVQLRRAGPVHCCIWESHEGVVQTLGEDADTGGHELLQGNVAGEQATRWTIRVDLQWDGHRGDRHEAILGMGTFSV